MIETVQSNLHRQRGALGTLRQLLEEEFSYLKAGEPGRVTGVEMSIQELMRQIAAERVELKMTLQKQGMERLLGWIDTLPAESAQPLRDLTRDIDLAEQECARQADRNNKLALALYDQSKELIEFLHDQVKPKRQDVYARNGRYAGGKSGPSLLRGRY
ncbi:flagellar export chaperone FlgN [Desulfohalovibrio reitneri]|uniref:flagellar export chaperone FlgN n=1 Tax=Desulfohalovibrio reitneri TaxID=1307759 RepID=UPI0004A75307|nr:flagellar export chaperone FlgN [Desulfohalovibrio reitneri]